MSTKPLGNLVRIVPLELSDLPPHPLIPQEQLTDSSPPSSNPHLVNFLRAILSEASTFLSPSTFSTTFKPLSTKSSSPSSSAVELYKREIPASEISRINWSEQQKIPRRKPANIQDENWFARRSVHENVSSKQKEGTASWAEFVFGLKEQHSKHEQEFSPSLYDAHYVLDWNAEIKNAVQQHGSVGEDGIEDEGGNIYTDVTMESTYSPTPKRSSYSPQSPKTDATLPTVYEMCHTLPPPLSPRCFPVLVLTAYTSAQSFLAVTVPVNLPSGLQAAYYSSGRNTNDPAASDQMRKRPVFAVYAAVERVRMLSEEGGGKEKEEGDNAGMIEWIMATASDTKGNLPMFLQKPNLPGAVKKDVGFFMGWIRGVE